MGSEGLVEDGPGMAASTGVAGVTSGSRILFDGDGGTVEASGGVVAKETKVAMASSTPMERSSISSSKMAGEFGEESPKLLQSGAS